MRFSEAFSVERPKASVDTVVTRLKKSKIADVELAEYLKERAKIEESYALQLAKLSKKTLSQDAREGFGSFAGIVDSVIAAGNEMSNLHMQMCKSIMAQVDPALRDTRALDDALRVEGNVSKGAKAFEEKIGNLRKAREKASKKASSKNDSQISEASGAYERGRNEFARELTAFLDRAQNAEETRLRKLKDAINNWVNVETGSYQKATQVPDKVLVNVVSAEVSSEIDDFCARHAVQGQAQQVSGGSPIGESSFGPPPTPAKSGLPSFSGFGFKGLTRATSILSLGNKLGDTMKSASSSKEMEPSPSRNFEAFEPSAPVNYTLDEEGYRVVVHNNNNDPFANSARNFEDDEDEEGHVPQAKLKVEIKQEAINDGAEDMAAVMSNMVERMKMGGAAAAAASRKPVERQGSSSSVGGATVETSPGEVEASEGSAAVSPEETAGAMEVVPVAVPAPTVSHGPVHLRLKLMVTETVNAVLTSAGQVSKILVVGEVGLALDGNAPIAPPSRPGHFNLFFRDSDAIDKVAANTSFCSGTEGDDSRSFACDLGSIIGYAPTEASALPLLKYQVRVPEGSYDKFAPLGIRTKWKAEPSQTSLMLLYQYNPSDALSSTALSGVDILVSLSGTADVANVQCKPNGPWNKDRRILLWRLGDLSPSGEEPGKLIARFETGASPAPGADGGVSPADVGAAAQLPPGPINVRFSCSGALLSGTNLGAGISGESGELATVEIVEVRKQVVAGKYVILP